ncbi:MAG: beta-ketoacyl synthase, partial [Phycisphaerae bacterium]
MNRRVVITGMGWVTPLGCDVEAVWKRLLAGDSGVSATETFDASTFPTQFSAQVHDRDFDFTGILRDRLDKHMTASRNTRFALAAAELAWRSAGFNGTPPADPEMVGVYLGGGEGPLDFENCVPAGVGGWNAEKRELDSVAWAKIAYQHLTAEREFEQDPNCAAGHIAYRFNAQGPNFNTLTACAASTQAIGEATAQIRRGDADIMISGGAHSMIHPLGVTGFNRLTALSTRNDTPTTASRPFDRTRDGFVLGEGSGILILEEYEVAKQRGANILAEIVGYGSTADA